MAICQKIEHIFEPTPLQCGQAVLAMLAGVSVEKIIKICGTDRETTLKDMKKTLEFLQIPFDSQRFEVHNKNDLPKIAVLSLETPHCWHWSLYCDGVFYDPEYGVLEDFPPSNRRYYFKIG